MLTVISLKVINAEQFKLPLELESSEILPFSWKWSDERAADDLEPHGGGNGRKLLCFVCAKSSRNMPAVACDFCPNVYHLDCLDPPLCEVPSKVCDNNDNYVLYRTGLREIRCCLIQERWMCPAHVEHAIDSKLVTSTSLTERLRLWNKYARGPVDTDAIRLDFFRKARRGRLYQRCNLRTSRDDRVKVTLLLMLGHVIILNTKEQRWRFPCSIPGPPIRKGSLPQPTGQAPSNLVKLFIPKPPFLPRDRHDLGQS